MPTLITNVYNDVLSNRSLRSGWGWSCYIEHDGKKILFDTGGDSYKLLFNLDNTGIDPKAIDFAILSHNHWDHIGGLEAVIEANQKMQVYLGSSFPEEFRIKLSTKGIEFQPVDALLSLGETIWVGPEMQNGGPEEIALALGSQKGLIIVTGCAHPGIVNVVKEYQKLSERIYLVIGGFHLYRKPVAKVKEVISTS